MSKTEDYKDIYEISRKEIQIWRDESGKNRARAQIAEIDAANAKLVLESNLKETIRVPVLVSVFRDHAGLPRGSRSGTIER